MAFMDLHKDVVLESLYKRIYDIARSENRETRERNPERGVRLRRDGRRRRARQRNVLRLNTSCDRIKQAVSVVCKDKKVGLVCIESGGE